MEKGSPFVVVSGRSEGVSPCNNTGHGARWRSEPCTPCFDFSGYSSLNPGSAQPYPAGWVMEGCGFNPRGEHTQVYSVQAAALTANLTRTPSTALSQTLTLTLQPWL